MAPTCTLFPQLVIVHNVDFNLDTSKVTPAPGGNWAHCLQIGDRTNKTHVDQKSSFLIDVEV